MKATLAEKMCRCVKKVRTTLKNRTRNARESRAIAICVRSVLQKKRGKTLKRFSCGKTPMLETQPFKEKT